MTNTPTFPPKLAAALCKVSGDVKQLGKSERNNFANYDFVSVDKFYTAIGSLMAQHGVHCIPDCLESEVLPGHVKRDQQGREKQGAPLLRERWAFTLIHESGECAGPYHRTVTVPAEGAQAHGSSESYAQKQFLRGVFRVPTGDKDDADYQQAQTHAPAQKPSLKIDTERAALIDNNLAAVDKTAADICKAYKVEALTDLTEAQADQIEARIKKLHAEKSDG